MTSPKDDHATDRRPHEGASVDRNFGADDLYAVRAEVTAHASHLGASESQMERLLIIASELATNAVRHGGGVGHLVMWREKELLLCRVSDHGPGIGDPARGSERPEPAAVGGRGLWLCRQLSDSLDISRTDNQTVITAIIDLDRSETA